MRAFLALIRREYLEHKGTFVYAPLIITGLIVLAQVLSYSLGRFDVDFNDIHPIPIQFYEIVYLGGSGLWGAYLMLALFFYFANAFSADRNNNSMLFWKSMPQSDLKILSAKVAAGIGAFPVISFGFMLFTGLLAYITTLMTASSVPGFIPPSPGHLVGAFAQVSLVLAGCIVVAMAWYVPFFAWVGMLSTLVGRWAIPLAFVIPGILTVAENLVVSGPSIKGGIIWNYLSHRIKLDIERDVIFSYVVSGQSIDAGQFMAQVLSRIDWIGMGTGWLFAAAMVYLASEYRRRVLGN